MNEHDDDFAAMLEASLGARRFERGETVEGTIAAIGGEVAFVSVGGKSEAQIEVAELKDSDGNLEFAVGDRVDARVVSTVGGLVLSRKGVRNAESLREIEAAFQDGLAVEGKVVGAVKGGFEVRVARERAFCPISQIDMSRTDDPSVHEGKLYTFRIIEFKEGGRNIVVSRRKQLEEEQRALAEEVRKSIVRGAVLRGRVASVVDFGAFVDLGGGVQGLLHVSDMSWSRIERPQAVVGVGDPVTVKVLGVDENRISLGLKQLEDDPWTRAASRYQVGQIHTGRVTRVVDFGAFVELEPGIEALAHASTFPPSGDPRQWADAVPRGATARFAILGIEPEKKRMSVAMVEDREFQDEERTELQNSNAPAFGSLADKLRDALGPGPSRRRDP